MVDLRALYATQKERYHEAQLSVDEIIVAFAEYAVEREDLTRCTTDSDREDHIISKSPYTKTDREEREEALTFWQERYKSTKSQLDVLQYALKRNKEATPDSLAVDLVRLAEKHKEGRLEWDADGWLVMARKSDGFMVRYWSKAPTKPGDNLCFRNPRAAVAAALKEVEGGR